MIGLAPGRHDDAVRRGLHPAVALEEGGDGLAQRRDARRGHVVGVAFAQRLDGGLDDVRGGREVRLADLQVNDLVASGLHGLGPGEYFEGGLGAEPAHAVCQPEVCHGLMINL